MTETDVASSETEFEEDPCLCASSEQKLLSSSSTTTEVSCVHKPFTCSCYAHLEASKLTHNKVLALIWALTSVLNYSPSDPLHYMSYQLLHWKYDNVPQPCVKDVLDYIDSQL
ncbi:hypothetical protein KPH14_003693 [Odynerus spinipes]|uniref:Uncharacterized protein n=1 Tax=Odynerus spinipes TaxID=1348599 RepID=A0AAD9RX47_9HYME|nr:hypothetical protein KPH14_003693 [Odynerus spinipes]